MRGIKTKFHVGDIVYYKNSPTRVRKTIINAVVIKQTTQGINISYELKTKGNYGYNRYIFDNGNNLYNRKDADKFLKACEIKNIKKKIKNTKNYIKNNKAIIKAEQKKLDELRELELIEELAGL